VSANEVWPRVSVRLRMDDQHGVADLCSKRVLAGQRADFAIKYDVGRD
jgi:hypothetical protein